MYISYSADGVNPLADEGKIVSPNLGARALATLRGLSLPGILAAKADGVLSFGTHHKLRAWFIKDEYAGSARRLDGKLWRKEAAKAWDVPGTSGESRSGWPVGILCAKGRETIVVCEGGPDLLGAYSVREELRADFGIVCVLGSGLTIHESARIHFAGKRIRFIAHADTTGFEFAQRNALGLFGVAEHVSIVTLEGLRKLDGVPAIDLCDVLAFRTAGTMTEEIAKLFDFSVNGHRVRSVPTSTAIAVPSQLSVAVTQDDSRITQGGHTMTQRMGGKSKHARSIQDLHAKACELAATARGQSRKLLFSLARAVLGFEKSLGYEDRGMRDSVFETWYAASRSQLDPRKKRPDYLARFRVMFRKVRIIPGQRDTLKEAETRARASTWPEIPDAPDASNEWRLLAAVCRELQHLAGSAPFYISTRDAAGISIGQRHAETGRRLLEALTEFGVIKCVKRGQPRPGGDASEFRYLLP